MDLVIRAVIVYFFLLLLLRAAGKRELGQLSPIDFVVLLIISGALQQALTNGDRSMIGGMILASTLVLLHVGMSIATYWWSGLRNVVNGVPVILVQDGQPIEDAMKAEHIPEDDILSEARKVGIESMDLISKAVLETSGSINIIPKEIPSRHPPNEKEGTPV